MAIEMDINGLLIAPRMIFTDENEDILYAIK